MAIETDNSRELLRHTLATVAYRGGKALRNAPVEFATFRAGESTRTPLEILTHLGDLFGWAASIAKGKEEWKGAEPQDWNQEVERFFAGLKELDRLLSSSEPLACSAQQLFQGPIADALTHVGQIAMLRRMAGTPIRAENYFIAEMTVGKVGAEQSAPRFEFD
ncbi:MAG TPA: hypothetical protein VMZ30_21650 [Pyrinomonadaceae bacterium]|nr:hypothetical protein [Pyrinomonadaceae bacterium]